MRRQLQFRLGAGLVFISSVVAAQDVPLFSQKLTNAFIYNPALAGHTFGSVTYSLKQSHHKVKGAPQNHFLSVHAPIGNYHFGIGASMYQENVTFLRNTFATAAFAYHIAINKVSTLSFGVSGEYNSISTRGSLNFQTNDQEFNELKADGLHAYDFSFGTHFQNRYLKAGLATNRLATTWRKDDDKALLSNYFSTFVQGLIPLRAGADLLEPYVAYRKLSETNNILDVGLYYTYDNKITLGGSIRSGSVLSATVGFRLTQYLMLGYSREMITKNEGGFVGAANEFTLRFDFKDQSYKQRFGSNYKSPLSQSMKELNGLGKSRIKVNKQGKRKHRKHAFYSPMRRY